MKFSTKQVTTFVISTVIMLLLFAIFVLFFNDSQIEKVSYIYDDVNICNWEQEVITSSTEAVDLDLELVKVSADKESQYLANAAANDDCVAKLGDTAGAYVTQLNKIFEQQQ